MVSLYVAAGGTEELREAWTVLGHTLPNWNGQRWGNPRLPRSTDQMSTAYKSLGIHRYHRHSLFF